MDVHYKPFCILHHCSSHAWIWLFNSHIHNVYMKRLTDTFIYGSAILFYLRHRQKYICLPWSSDSQLWMLFHNIFHALNIINTLVIQNSYLELNCKITLYTDFMSENEFGIDLMYGLCIRYTECNQNVKGLMIYELWIYSEVIWQISGDIWKIPPYI